jgi:hypothetical protein
MLVLIRVVALVPIGVGLAVSRLAGTAHVPSGPLLPPTVTVTSPKGSVQVQPASYSWTSGTHQTRADHSPAVASTEPLLRIASGGQLTFTFSGKAAPSSVRLGLDSAVPGPVVVPTNPLVVSFRKPAGTYSVVVSTNWTQGRADYYLRVEVT